MAKFTKINDLTAAIRANIETDLKDGTLGQVAIAEKHDCGKGVVRMVNLQLKAAVVEDEVKIETGAEVKTETDAEVSQTNTLSKAEKLAALKAQVGEQDIVTETNKPKTTRTKKAPVDMTSRDVIVASSQSANVAWMSGNISFKGKTDTWAKAELIKIAKTRKGDAAINLAALATADDLLFTRNEAVLVEEHEAVMAGHWDRLEGESYTMIGRRPKGFKRAPAPRVKKEVVEQTDEDIDAEIAKLMAAKAAKAKKAEETTETAVEDTTTGPMPTHYAPVLALTSEVTES